MPDTIDTLLHETALVAAGEENHASYLRRRYADEGGMQGVVDTAVRQFRKRNAT